eukprot:2788859-Rhodomonas_salina.1
MQCKLLFSALVGQVWIGASVMARSIPRFWHGACDHLNPLSSPAPLSPPHRQPTLPCEIKYKQGISWYRVYGARN